MKLAFSFLLILPFFLHAQNIVRRDKESADAFIQRQKPPHAKRVHQIIETGKWIENKNIILVFFSYGDSTGYALDTIETGMGYDKFIFGYLYLPLDGNNYTKILIDTFPVRNNELINIESVFFTNADENPDKELAIIVTKYVDQSTYHGIVYSTHFYKKPDSLSQARLLLLKDISEKFSGGCECITMLNKIRHAKYRSAKEIKEGLKKMGIK
jgi:hypothetical protein